MGYGDPRGMAELRQALKQMLSMERFMNIAEDEICIVRGSQMGIFLASRALPNRQGVIVVEELYYPSAFKAFQSNGFQVVSVKLDDQGIVIEDLERILPPLSTQETLEVASIYSISNTPHTFGQRPFRAPHHTASAIALVGGGSHPKPGEITLSHLGVLFLDELPEFDRKVLEVLRQPLESKEIIISRAARQITYPANFQLIAAMNPCPCGYAFNQDSRCQCSPESIKRYQNRISGPLLDRIDLHIDVPPLKAQELQDPTPAEDSTTVRQRVIYAYEQQMQRQGCLNQALSPKQLEQHAVLDSTSQRMIEMAQQRLNLSARAYHRVLRVARTIADLAQSEVIQSPHLTEALSYRGNHS